MRTRYGVVWREDGGPVASGKAEFLPDALRLEGLCRRMPAIRTIAYTDIVGIRPMTHGEVTVDGRPTVILELRSSARVDIASAVTGRLVGELVVRLTPCQECSTLAR
jgi:hypothetical protein